MRWRGGSVKWRRALATAAWVALGTGAGGLAAWQLASADADTPAHGRALDDAAVRRALAQATPTGSTSPSPAAPAPTSARRVPHGPRPRRTSPPHPAGKPSASRAVPQPSNAVPTGPSTSSPGARTTDTRSTRTYNAARPRLPAWRQSPPPTASTTSPTTSRAPPPGPAPSRWPTPTTEPGVAGQRTAPRVRTLHIPQPARPAREPGRRDAVVATAPPPASRWPLPPTTTTSRKHSAQASHTSRGRTARGSSRTRSGRQASASGLHRRQEKACRAAARTRASGSSSLAISPSVDLTR